MIFSVQFRVIGEHNCLALSRVKYGPLCPICYHLCNLKNEKSTHGGLLYLIKLQAKVCNSTKSNTPPLVFFTFLKLYKWYQIAQSISYFIIVHNVSGLYWLRGHGFLINLQIWRIVNFYHYLEKEFHVISDRLLTGLRLKLRPSFSTWNFCRHPETFNGV